MQRLQALALAPSMAASAVVRAGSSQPSRAVSYGLPIATVTAVMGLTLLLAPAVTARGFLEVLLLAVPVVALGLGLRPALVAVALAAAAAVLLPAALGRPMADAARFGEATLFVAQGAMMAFIGVVVRAAIGVALRSPADGARADDGVSPTARVAPAADAVLVEPLTSREVEVLRAAAGGRSAPQLAADLHLSTNTVKTHLSHCYDKLGAHNRAEAVALALRCGCLAPEDVQRAAARSGDAADG